jgi:hypothetical protein
MRLSDKLQAIAQGETFSCQALHDAINHPVSTRNDCLMLNRYLYGANRAADRFTLQRLAISIGEYDAIQ